MTIEERVRKVLIDAGIDPEKITLESDIINDLGADSLNFIEIVMAMEEEFDIEISDDDAKKLRTVQDFINYAKDHAK
ncbi:MAG: acyl carrier protein [Patescibacteria group bacterium]